MSIPPLRARLESYVQPAMLLGLAAYHFLLVVFQTASRNPFGLLKIQHLRDEAFSSFWLSFAAEQAPDSSSGKQPESPVAMNSAQLIPPLIALANGTVLDVGPGTGTQIPIFATNHSIRTVYAAEPCLGLHTELRRRVDKADLPFEYRILACGAEEVSLLPALAGDGLLRGHGHVRTEGVFDAIVCVRVLCSVPEVHETLKGLYALLKSRGKLIIVEHVRNDWRGRSKAQYGELLQENKGSVVARLFQILYTYLGWSFFIGDCNLGRDIASAALEAAREDGGWSKVDLKVDFEYSPLPYLSGFLEKK